VRYAAQTRWVRCRIVDQPSQAALDGPRWVATDPSLPGVPARTNFTDSAAVATEAGWHIMLAETEPSVADLESDVALAAHPASAASRILATDDVLAGVDWQLD
jgi:hypothetical protein